MAADRADSDTASIDTETGVPNRRAAMNTTTTTTSNLTRWALIGAALAAACAAAVATLGSPAPAATLAVVELPAITVTGHREMKVVELPTITVTGRREAQVAAARPVVVIEMPMITVTAKRSAINGDVDATLVAQKAAPAARI
jgi:hypothetical protein